MILELNTSNYISALGCHSAFFFFTIKTFSQKQLLDILRGEIFAQADALTNVVGKMARAVIAASAFIHIRYGTRRKIHQRSTVTFNHTDETLLTLYLRTNAA